MSLEFKNQDLLAYYEYLGNVLYSSEPAGIDLDKMSNDENRAFAEVLMQFGNMATETREFAFSISRGELDCKPPTRGNELAAPLKSLHATLKHLTWQAQQISQGDYDQNINFMGEFSEAFNKMVTQLAERRSEMEFEAERNKERMEELAKANSIFEAITGKMEEWIVMVDRTTGKHLFSNHPAASILAEGIFEYQLQDILFEFATSIGSDDEPRKEEFSLISDCAMQYFEITLYPIRWFEYDAVACVLADVTASKEEYSRLEDAAYKDVMTGVYNRLYGMKLLDKYAEEKTAFELVFVDMDMLKYVNDIFGHAEGDAYIKSVADILQEVSGLATVCRLGGDEFMVIIKENDLPKSDITEVFETLRTKLANTSVLDKDGCPLYYRSISFGCIKVGETSELTTSDILSMADERMYEYKKAHKLERRT